MIGRPKIHIDYDKVYSLRENRYNWVDIAKILDVSVTKLVVWRKSINFVEPLNTINDNNQADTDAFFSILYILCII